jgi:uncharacterized repeat protein (TIGR01451 family)
VIITSPGPLSSITVTPDLTCQVYLGTTASEWLAGNGISHCGTFLALGGTMYRPGSLSTVVTGTSYSKVSQSAVSGSGTAASPFRIVTQVRADTKATVIQTDSYVTGNDYYSTSLTVSNITAGALGGTLYMAGNCSVSGNTNGYGVVNGTSPSCAATQAVNSRGTTLIPLTSGNSYEYTTNTNITAILNARAPLQNICDSCNTLIENAMGISWPVSVGAGQSQTFSWATSFGQVGGAPLAVSATAHASTTGVGTANGYRVQVANPTPVSQAVSAVTVTLPAGFSYTAGSTTGNTISNPSVAGQVLTWTGPFTVASGAVLTVDFGVTVSGTPGTYTLDATATSAHAVVPASGTAPVTVTTLADLSISSTASNDQPAPGDTFSYAILVDNAGPSDVPSATVTDTLPAGLSFVSGAGCTASGQVVTCAVGAIPAGGNAALTVTVAVSAGAPVGVVSNTVVVSSGTPDPSQLNNSFSESVLITNPVALTITKTVSAPTVDAGANVTFTITVGNTGAGTAAATLVDSLPSGLTAVSVTGPGCTLSPVICAMTVPGGGSATVTLVAQAADNVPAGTVLTNSAAVNAPNNSVPAGITATSSVTVTTASHLVLTKVQPSGLVAGTTGIYKVTVLNQGPSVASGVTVTDPLPAGFTLNAAGSSAGCTGTTTVTCLVDAVDVGESITVTIAVNVPATTAGGTSVTNTASAAGDQPNPVPADATASVTGTVVRLTNLVVGVVSNTDSVVAGDTITYTLPVASKGPSDAANVTLTNVMPAGVTATAATVTTGTGTCTLGAPVSCALGTLAAGSTAVVTITATVDPAATGTLTDTATVTTTDPLQTQETASASEHTSVTATAGLSASTVASSDQVAAGEALNYTISVTNMGPSDATGVALSDPLPAGYVATSATADNGAACVIAGGSLTCADLGTLTVNGKVTVTLLGAVDDGQPAGTMTNTATFTDAEGGSAVGIEQTTIIVDADVTVTKTSPLTSVVAGSPVTWTISVHNAGPSDAVNVPVTELPSADVKIGTLSTSAGTCDQVTHICTITNITDNTTADIQVTGTADPDATGTLTNCAAYKSPDGAAEDSTGCVDLTTSQLATLTLTKTSDPATAIAGQRVTYHLTAGDDGPSTATNTVVTDTLPAGLTFDPGGSSTGCTATGQAVSCPVGLLDPGDTLAVTVVATLDPAAPGGTVTNTATATAAEAPVPATASVGTAVVDQADLVISKTAAPSAYAGQDLTWNIRVDSIGPSTATGAVITSTIPAGTTFVSATPSSGTCAFDAATELLTCQPGPIPDDTNVTIALVTHIPANLVPPGQTSVVLSDPATVTFAGDPNPVNNSATAAVTVFPLATLQVTKTASAPVVVAGTAVTFHGTVKNTGPSLATGVTYIGSLPTGLAFDAAKSDPRCKAATGTSGAVVQCTTASLAPGASTTFVVVDRIAPALGPRSVLISDAQATAVQSDPANVATARVQIIVVRRVSIVVIQTVSSNRLVTGKPVGFVIRVINRGPSVASNVLVANRARTAVSAMLLTGAALACPPAINTLRCVVRQLAPGASVLFLVTIPGRSVTARVRLLCDTAQATPAEPNTSPTLSRDTDCARRV